MARESALTRGGRVAFGGLVEAEKASGGGGTKNARGDFTVGELRAIAPASDGAVVDRSIRRGAAVLDLEREVRRLEAATVQVVRRSLGGALELGFAHAVLQLPRTHWLLSADGHDRARGDDEPAWALARLRELEGRTVTRAGFRRRDHAIALELADDPFAAAHELLVRGWRQRQPWSLTTADGVRCGPGARSRG